MNPNEIEKQLIACTSRDEALLLLEGYTLSELKVLATNLQAYPTRKTKDAYRDALINHTYEAVKRSKMICNIQ